jgi:hypothetical protein
MNYIHVIHPTGQPSAVRECFLHFLALDAFLLAEQKKVSRQRRNAFSVISSCYILINSPAIRIINSQNLICTSF